MRFGGVVWALILGISAGQTCSYVVRSLPRFGRARRAPSGTQSLRCGATSGLIEVRFEGSFVELDRLLFMIHCLCVRYARKPHGSLVE